MFSHCSQEITFWLMSHLIHLLTNNVFIQKLAYLYHRHNFHFNWSTPSESSNQMPSLHIGIWDPIPTLNFYFKSIGEVRVFSGLHITSSLILSKTAPHTKTTILHRSYEQKCKKNFIISTINVLHAFKVQFYSSFQYFTIN